ncbi:MAG: GNAT family N-acetyltransferase [Aquabacterium sp.]
MRAPEHRGFAWPAEGIGRFTLRPLALEADVPLLHRWVTQPRAAFWGMQHCTPADVHGCYRQQMAGAHTWPFMGLLDGQPAFLLETYDPAHDLLAAHYDLQAGDIGMHFLIAPNEGEAPIHGFSLAVMRTILAFLFSQAGVCRVVVEPDVRNAKVHALNEAAGFRHVREIHLPHKTARLGLCLPGAFHASLRLPTTHTLQEESP